MTTPNARPDDDWDELSQLAGAVSLCQMALHDAEPLSSTVDDGTPVDDELRERLPGFLASLSPGARTAVRHRFDGYAQLVSFAYRLEAKCFGRGS